MSVDLNPSGGINARNVGVWDFITGFRSWRLWAFLALHDIRQRYRRSSLGPLWLAAGLGVTILGIGLLYSQILKTPATTYIPFLSISLLVWNYLSMIIIESTTLFATGATMMTTMRMPYTSFVLRCLVRNLIVAAHCAIPVVIAFVIYRYPVRPVAFAAIPGLLLFLANCYWISLIVAIACLRYRDIAQIIIYLVQIALFITPILWVPTQVRPNTPAVQFNPIYHLLMLIRDPIYNGRIPIASIEYCVFMLIIGSITSISLFMIYRRKLVYWI